MSGVETLGILSGIITLLDATYKLYRTAKNTSGLPGSFRETANRLPLVQETLAKIQNTLIENDWSASSELAVKLTLEGCRAKATTLQKIFETVIAPAGASRMERYFRALRTISKTEQVEDLMKGILADLQILTGNYTFQTHGLPATAKEKIADWKTVSGGEVPSTMVHRYSNTGSGAQMIHWKEGNQSSYFGNGAQLNGPLGGSLYLTLQS